MSVLQDAEPLIFKREMKKATNIVDEKVSGYRSKISDLDKELAKLEKQKAKLKPVIENYSATTRAAQRTLQIHHNHTTATTTTPAITTTTTTTTTTTNTTTTKLAATRTPCNCTDGTYMQAPLPTASRRDSQRQCCAGTRGGRRCHCEEMSSSFGRTIPAR